MKSNIQWFPGHMAKAIRQFEENISLVDMVFELVDARIPYTSINPEVKRISGNKPRLMVLTKADLADPQMTQAWVNYFKKQGIPAIAVDSKVNGVRKRIEHEAEGLYKKINNSRSKNVERKIIKAICIGVPNVGKSTLLNQIVSKKSAAVGNRPGITKGEQWLTSNGKLELLDTPGILWPKFQNQEIAEKLSLTGAIREKSYHSDDVALYALEFLKERDFSVLKHRYHLNDEDYNLENPDLLLKITKNIGMQDDYDRASDRIINDFRKGKLGRFTLDSPELISD